MKCKKVADILLPFREGMRIYPSVSSEDKIIYAIEIMVKNNFKEIAVITKDHPAGLVRLEDALRVLGLNVST